ncbi:DUF5342 family protein [Virgibacillus sp. W0430]|uniref:DUF5342 family protein n=1 Tax=Virgibacillus sp. W0430 TaxID=3391580 RepID=UPI003F452D8C
MVDDFEMKTLYTDRTYERQRFSFSFNGKEYEGDFYKGSIQWLHPHPQQDVDASQLEWIEAFLYRLVRKQESNETIDGIEIKPMLESNSQEVYQFQLTIEEEVYKGIIRHGKLEWFHPKPRRKLTDAHVDKVEENVHTKIKDGI